MKKEKIDNIQVEFLITNEEFTKSVHKNLTVSIVQFDGTIQFETRIPDFIYNECIKQYPDIYDQDYIENLVSEHMKIHGTTFNLKYSKPKSRILRSPLLQNIKEELFSLSNKLITLNTFEEKNGEKMLFIYFKGQTVERRDMNFGADMGILNSIEFQYFVGYRFVGLIDKYLSEGEKIMVEKYSSYYKRGIGEGLQQAYKEHEMCPLHRIESEKENLKRKYILVPWSEEREQYLKEIQTNFTIMTDKLNEFLKDLTEIKLDHLIENQPINKMLTN